MGWLALSAAAAATLATALAGAGVLRLRSFTSFALAVYLLASAELVLLGELLSLLHAVGAAAYAVCHAVVLALAAAFWHRQGRPGAPAFPWPGVQEARRHPIVGLLLLVVGAAVAYQLLVVLSTPPNNWDSMSYHLPRAVEWLQRGAVEYVPDAPTDRINAYQPGSEIEILWTLALLGSDAASGLPQFFAELAALLGIYGIARRTGFDRPEALFSALLAGTLTLVALESVTTQNDLLAASFVVAAAALLLGRTRPEVLLAAVAVGLALGTKLTAAYALPLLFVLALGLPRRRLAEGLAAAAVAFLLLGAYGYVLNVVETGRVLGAPSASEPFRPAAVTWDGTVSTVARIGYRFIDLSGLHAKSFVPEAVERGGREAFARARIDPNPPESTTVGSRFDFAVGQAASEDLSFFGPLGFLVYLPLSLGFLVAAIARKASWEQGALAAAIPLTMIEIALTYRYNVWIGRFLIAPVLLTAPLVAVLYRWRLLAAAAAAVGAVTLVAAHAFNVAKPVGFDGTTPIWSLSRTHAQALARPGIAEALAVVERVPSDARVGFVSLEEWVYPLYGRQLDRRVVRLEGRSAFAEADRLGVDWVVVGSPEARVDPDPSWLRVTEPDSPWTIYRRG